MDTFYKSFAESFRAVLPDGESSLKNDIEKTLRKRKGEAIYVEFGGISVEAVKEFTPDFFHSSFGITLADHRKDRLSAIAQDEKLHHKVLEGDIFDPKTYESLNNNLAGKKVDLIMSRMAGGLELVPLEPYIVSKTLSIWYDLLNEGGLMFVQVPVALNELFLTWVHKIKQEFKDKLEINYVLGFEDDTPSCSAFRLRKLPGAPDELPLLSPKVTKLIPKTHKVRRWRAPW